jgi:hypothetical protein
MRLRMDEIINNRLPHLMPFLPNQPPTLTNGTPSHVGANQDSRSSGIQETFLR